MLYFPGDSFETCSISWNGITSKTCQPDIPQFGTKIQNNKKYNYVTLLEKNAESLNLILKYKMFQEKNK
jgi:hypothetical protein